MRRRLFAAGPLSVVLMFAQNATHTADRDELQRLERVWNAAHLRGDSETLTRLWADDLEVAIPKMPVMKKEELIKFVDSGRMKFQRYEDVRLELPNLRPKRGSDRKAAAKARDQWSRGGRRLALHKGV